MRDSPGTSGQYTGIAGVAQSKAEVWYQLVTEDGGPYEGSGVRVIDVEDGYPVAKFLKKVYEKNKLLLK